MREMSGRRNLIEDNTGYMNTGIEILETINKRCHGVSGYAGIDEKYHRKIQQTGHFCRTALHPSIAIKKSSHAFRYTNIRLLTILII